MSEEKENRRELDTEPPMMLPPDLHSLDGGPAEAPEKSPEQAAVDDSTASTELLSRIKIPGFRIERELGRGGMGAVFLATDETLNRRVALKIVSQSLVGSRGLRERFDSEVRTLASLQHTHIAQLYSAGLTGDEPYFVMEFVDGPTLDDHARDPLGDAKAAELVSRLCEAVEYCHQQGVIHRDLKPSNILMTSKGQPKIADFGLAKALHRDDSATRTGEILGTPGYMSPEQAGGVVKSIGPTCDVYGLGAILYRLLTGRAPFVSPEPFQTVIQVLADDPIPPRQLNRSVSRDLETICLKCLEKKTSKRYESARELQEDLQRFLDGKPIRARPHSWLQVSGKWMRRHPAISVSIAALVLTIAGALIGLVMHNRVLSRELARSSRLANSGSEFAKWITEEHLSKLVEIGGTTGPRTELVQRVSQFLEESYNDMPADPIFTERLGFTYSQLAETQAGGQNTTGDLQPAREHLIRAIDLYDRTLQQQTAEDNSSRHGPDDNDFRRRVKLLKVDALISQADLELRLGQPEAQQQLLLQAGSLLDEVQQSSAESIFVRIQLLNRVIEQQMEQREFAAALETSQQLISAVDQLESVADDRQMPEVTNQRIIIHSYRGNCLKNLDRLADAESEYREMVRLAQAPVDADPDNVLNLDRLATTQVQLADILFGQEKAEESLEYYQQATDIAWQLAKNDPASVDAQLNLGIKLSRVATNQQYLGNLDLAEQAIEKAIEQLKKLEQAGKQDVAIQEGILIYLQNQASLSHLQGKSDAARQLFDQHRQRCEAFREQFAEDSFAINQLAESSLTQALMLLGIWVNTPIDPATVRQAPEYQKIVEHLKNGKRYYVEFQQLKPLDLDQRQQLKRLEDTEALLEQVVADIEATAGPPDQ